jgi:hypothetical protein
MLEMKLNTTATVDSVGLDPVNVVPYQKTRKLGDRDRKSNSRAFLPPFKALGGAEVMA